MGVVTKCAIAIIWKTWMTGYEGMNIVREVT